MKGETPRSVIAKMIDTGDEFLRFIPSGTECYEDRVRFRRNHILFMSEDEIVKFLTDTLGVAEVEVIKSSSDVMEFHHSFGQFIRNSFGLWDSHNPFVDGDAESERHPDQMSHRIMERLKEEFTRA